MSEQRLRRLAALCGILGPLALVVYFGVPALAGWPYGGGTARQLILYARSHQELFYAGAWFQATGTLLSIVFFLALVHLAGTATRFAGTVVVVASSALLALVLAECVFLVAIPGAALNGDGPTVVNAFTLVNGVFARVFPLAPSSATYIALGAVILGAGVLPRWLGTAAVAIGVAFEIVGVLAIVATAGLILAIVLSVVQALWIVAAAVALGRTAGARST